MPFEVGDLKCKRIKCEAKKPIQAPLTVACLGRENSDTRHHEHRAQHRDHKPRALYRGAERCDHASALRAVAPVFGAGAESSRVATARSATREAASHAARDIPRRTEGLTPATRLSRAPALRAH